MRRARRKLYLYGVVRVPPGVVMIASPETLRNAEGAQSEGYFKVDLVAFDVAVFDHDVLILDPSALYVPEGLGGPSYALLDGVLKALLRNSADLCHRSNAHIFLSHPLFGCSLTTTTHTFCLPPGGGG